MAVGSWQSAVFSLFIRCQITIHFTINDLQTEDCGLEISGLNIFAFIRIFANCFRVFAVL